jgi:hypothetical protein
MADAFHLREQAEQCLRLARGNTYRLLIKSLTALAAEYSARADEIEGAAFGKNSEDEQGRLNWRSRNINLGSAFSLDG